MRMNRLRLNRQGFTLIEIMIVVTIVGILMGLGIQQYTRYQRRAQRTRTEAELRTLQMDINTYHSDTGQYPASLEDLVRRPADQAIAARWKGKYLETDVLPIDPWGNDYVYVSKPKGSKPPYEIYSLGADADAASEETYIYPPTR